MATKSIITNIVGSTRKYDLSKIGQSFTLNMYEETVDANENFVTKVLRPIPGYNKICDIPGSCRGIYTVSNGYDGKPKTYCVFDDKLYLIYNNAPFEIGTLAYGSEPVHFCETAAITNNDITSHAHLLVVDGAACYAIDTQIRPANQAEYFCTIQLPVRKNSTSIQPTHIAYLYGYVVVNDKDSDNFYISYQFPFCRYNENDEVDMNIFMYGSEEWGVLGQYGQAYWQPDNTTALIANGSRLYVFGKKSFQVFQYTNDVNIPFVSPDTAAQMIGLKAVNSLCQLGSTIVWFGSSDIGNNGIYVCSNGSVSAQRVSTPEIEREISKFSNVEDAYAQIWQDNQHIFYVITFPSGNTTYCYDLTQNSWSNRCSLNSKNEKVFWRYNNACLNEQGKVWQGCNGAVVEQTEENWSEHDGVSILRLRRGGVIATDYSNFIINNIEVMTNNGQYDDYYDQPVKMMMRFTADGSRWTDIETVEIGRTGEYDYDCIFYNFGMARIFTIELSCSDNVPFALFGIKMNYDTMQY